MIAAPCAGAAKRRLGLVVICENVNVRSSYVCGQVHCIAAPQLHDALRPHARPSRDGAQPDGDDGPRRDDEPRQSDVLLRRMLRCLCHLNVPPFFVMQRGK